MGRLIFLLSTLAFSLMPVIAVAGDAEISAVGSFVVTGLITFLQTGNPYAALAVATLAAVSTYYSAKEAQKAARLASEAFASEAANRTQMVRQPVTNRRMIYGTVKVSGPVLFMHTTNNDDILHLIVGIAGHEIDGYEAFYLEDEEIELDGDPTTGLRNVTNTKYANDVKIQAYLGTAGQAANTNLKTEAPSLWTTDHKLSGIAYLYVRLNHNRDDFPSGIPSVRCIVRGKKVYDPRTATTAWTDNAALILRDYLADTTYGMAAGDEEIDSTSFTAGANLADEIVTITSNLVAVTDVDITNDIIEVDAGDMVFRTGDRVSITGSDVPAGITSGATYYAIAWGTNKLKVATSLANARAGTAVNLTDAGSGTIDIARDAEPRFTINGTVDTGKEPKAIIGSMMICQGASLSYAGGKFTLITASYATPTITLDEDDLISGLSVTPKSSRRDRFNSVKGVISDPGNNWQPTDFPAVSSNAFAIDDGEEIQNDLSLEYIISPSMAQRVAKIFLLDSRQEMVVSASYKLTALQCQVGDIIYLKNSRFGFTETTETVSSVSTTLDVLNLSSATLFKTGDKVTIDSSTNDPPGGLSEGTEYRIIKTGSAGVRLATTFQRAIDNQYINITDAGSGTITLTRPTKAFRVVDFSLSPTKQGDAFYLGVNMVLKEVDDSVYDYLTSEEVTVDPSRNTTLPSPFNSNLAPTGLTLNSGTDYLAIAGDGTVMSRINATWTAPTGTFTTFYELGYKRTGSTENYSTVIVPGSVTEYSVGPVEDGVFYDVTIRAINSMGLRSDASTVTGHEVVGKQEAPPDVSEFSVSRLPDGTRRFTFSTTNFPADVKAGGGVLIKYSTNLSASWDNMTQIRDIFRASPYETNELARGTYLFAIKMVDSSGNESTNAHTLTATIGDPRIRDALLYRIEEDEGWDGVYTNAWVTYENTLSSTAAGTWANLPSTWSAMSDTWASIVSSDSPITYTTPQIDLGANFSFTPLVTAQGQGTPTYTMQVGTSAQGGATGSFVSVANVQGVRYIKLRVSMADTHPFITGITTILDGEYVDQEFEDINIATYSNSNFQRIAAGHFRIGITNGAESVSTAFIMAIQGSGSTALFSNLVSKSQTVGGYPAAEFKIFNSSGTLTDATVDIFLKGPKGA
jgi:hypothetical protein